MRIAFLLALVSISAWSCQEASKSSNDGVPSHETIRSVGESGIGSPFPMIKGVTVADDFPDYTTPQARVLYDSLLRSGVEWIAITPCGFMDHVGDPDVSWTRWSKRDYAKAITLARAKGLKVLVKPYLWSPDFWTKKRWTGHIAFADSTERGAFFASYTTFLVECARQAQIGGAELFSVGLELPKLSDDQDRWRKLIDTIRSVFVGRLTYSAHGVGEASAIEFWDALDVVGVNTYPTLAKTDSADLQMLEKGWAPICSRLDALSKRLNKRIVFTETGFRSVQKAYDRPWEWPEHQPRRVNHEHQRLAYEALAKACYGQPWFGGVFWWKVFTDPSNNVETDDGFTPQGKPAWEQMSADFLNDSYK